MPRPRAHVSLETKIVVLVCLVVMMALLATSIPIGSNVAYQTQESLGGNALNVARMVARSPLVIRNLEKTADNGEIQVFANEIRTATEMEFVTVFDMNHRRRSHPDSNKVGQLFVGGDESRALEGGEYISMARGTLGDSLRAFAPVFSADGRQVGAVAVGILLDNVRLAVRQSREIVYLGSGLGLVIGLLGAFLLASNVKKTLFGLEPFAIARLLEERNAMLQSVREGVLAVDRQGRITLVNDEAGRLFELAGIGGVYLGKHVDDVVPNTRLKNVMASGQAELNQEQDLRGIILFTNRVPVTVDGEIVGAIATFRDKTEIRHLAEELTGVRSYAEALRAQAHNFMNKLHVILGMVRMKSYDQLGEYVSRIAQEHEAEVVYVGQRIRDTVLAGFVLGKLSRARELGVEMMLTEDSFLPVAAEAARSHELVTVAGNLIDNALEALADSAEKRLEVSFLWEAGELTLIVADSGPGIAVVDQERIFQRGYSSKEGNRGLGLALVKESLALLQGDVEVSSRPGEGTEFVVTLPYAEKEKRDD